MKALLYLALLIMGTGLTTSIQAIENPFVLPGSNQPKVKPQNPQPPSGSVNLLKQLLKGYSRTLSSFDGDRCPSYPVCSLYSKQAINKHGAIMGTWMTVDRLIRERTEIKTGARIIHQHQLRVYDPLHRNDFWH